MGTAATTVTPTPTPNWHAERRAAGRRCRAEPVSTEGWRVVVDNLPELERMARRMASVDRRLDADDMLGEFLADLAANAGLWEPGRGSWMSWARTRCWKARTLALRVLNRHEPRGARVDLTPGEGPDSVARDAVGAGGWGSAGRSEALVDLRLVCEDVERRDDGEWLTGVVDEFAGRRPVKRAAR